MTDWKMTTAELEAVIRAADKHGTGLLMDELSFRIARAIEHAATQRALEAAVNVCLESDGEKPWALAIKIRALIDGIPRTAITPREVAAEMARGETFFPAKPEGDGV
jgi:hypothetical protein